MHIKEQMCKIAYLKTTDMKSLMELVITKGVSNRVKLTSNDNYTKWSPPFIEYVYSFYSDSPITEPKESYSRGTHISKPSHLFFTNAQTIL